MGGCFSYRLELELELIREDNNLPQYLTRFSYKSLKKVTNNFGTIIRKHEFLTSYKGTLDDGSKVIVKVCTTDDRYGDFTSMIKIMSGIKHQNLVELIGYCIEGDHKMLVYEFVGDYSLHEVLFSDHVVLEWPKRVFICHRIVHALEYLHCGISPGVVHRDVKPYNVLLDSNFNPKIVGFELSSLIEEGELDYNGEVVGTLGYLDPEYFQTGRYSKKTDVYSFGITLLEIIAGRKNMLFGRSTGTDHIRNKILVNWALELRESGRIPEIVDPNLSEFSEDEVVSLVNVALSCVQLSSVLRPCMSEVRVMLSDGYDFSNMVLTRPMESRQISSDDEPMESGQISSDDEPMESRQISSEDEPMESPQISSDDEPMESPQISSDDRPSVS